MWKSGFGVFGGLGIGNCVFHDRPFSTLGWGVLGWAVRAVTVDLTSSTYPLNLICFFLFRAIDGGSCGVSFLSALSHMVSPPFMQYIFVTYAGVFFASSFFFITFLFLTETKSHD